MLTMLNRDIQKNCDTLKNVDLTQHVKQSTHNLGHILDLLISKGLNISNVYVIDVAQIIFLLTLKPFFPTDLIIKRCYKKVCYHERYN